jgi:hypothetical protein
LEHEPIVSARIQDVNLLSPPGGESPSTLGLPPAERTARPTA